MPNYSPDQYTVTRAPMDGGWDIVRRDGVRYWADRRQGVWLLKIVGADKSTTLKTTGESGRAVIAAVEHAIRLSF